MKNTVIINKGIIHGCIIAQNRQLQLQIVTNIYRISHIRDSLLYSNYYSCRGVREMTEWFLKNLTMAAERRKVSLEVIEYGMKTAGLFAGECTVALLISVLLHQLPGALAFVGLFTFLRGTCGGYHCKTYSSCMIMYVVLVNVCVFTWSVLYDVTVIILLLLSACFLFCVSPIENENNTLRKDQFDIFRRKARIRIAVSLLIILIFMRFSSAELWKPSALAVSALALLCLVQLRRNKR